MNDAWTRPVLRLCESDRNRLSSANSGLAKQKKKRKKVADKTAY